MRLNLRKKVIYTIVGLYVLLVIYALTNEKARCRVDMPIMVSDPLFTDLSEGHRCRVNINELGTVAMDIHEKVNLTDLEHSYSNVHRGGQSWPEDCQAWQKVAIIVPYRDRWEHLLLLLKRLHPMLHRQKIHYQIFVIEQDADSKFNRGRLMNIGVVEALKRQKFDCFIFHDVDLLPENDQNMYVCDDELRQLSSAIDEMRYHVMYYNYAGGVIALNRDNVFKVNGYSNDYWGWGSEDDDLSARTRESGLLLTRPPDHIGRFKMVRHSKSYRSDNGYGLFLEWRARWKSDGLNTLDSSKYQVVGFELKKLYTWILVDIGQPPSQPPNDPLAQRESLSWFLEFFFP